jgi:hypothetical protein
MLNAMGDDDKPGPTPEMRRRHELGRVVTHDDDDERGLAHKVLDQTTLDWCFRRGYIGKRQYRAGCQFRAVWHEARYDPPPPPSLDRIPGVSGTGGLPDAVLDARDEVTKALLVLGKTQGGLALSIIVEAKRLGQVERALGWRGGVARVALQMVLDRLAEHYNLTSCES